MDSRPFVQILQLARLALDETFDKSMTATRPFSPTTFALATALDVKRSLYPDILWSHSASPKLSLV